MVDESGMRRSPQQSRSKKRVDAIIHAAAMLIHTVGYEEASTSRIAQEAGIPVGTLYQFFPNKQAVLQALVERYLDDMQALLGAVFPPDLAAQPIEFIVDETVNHLVAFNATHPGFNQIMTSTWVPGDLRAAGHAIDVVLSDSVRAILKQLFPHLSEMQCKVSSAILLNLIQGVMPLTQTPDATENAIAAAELKRMGLAYLRSLGSL